MEAGEIYYRMHLIRECEERIRKEYSKDEIKTPTHLAVGAEAIAVGLAASYTDAKYFGTYRNHHLYLALGGDLDEFWGELYGKETGCAKGKAGSMHLSTPDRGLVLTSAVVGTTLPVAVGAAFGSSFNAGAYRNVPVISVFGDGATEEGVFHESLNFAALHKLKILFVCEDNGLAIHTHRETRQKYNLQKLVESYGIIYRSADGENLDEVLRISEYLKPLVQERPCFLHAKYHRFYEHVGSGEDYNAGYRQRPAYEHRVDPIKTLDSQNCVKSLTTKEKEYLKVQVAQEIENAVAVAKNAKYPDLKELTTDVFE